MSRNSLSRWAWIALAASLVCIPAGAQSYYSSIDIDIYGDIIGASVTEVPYYFYDFGYDAYAEGLLNDTTGDEIVDVIAWDDGEGYAEADTSGTALIAGDYGQYGNHDVFTYDEYLYEVLGSSMDSADWDAATCDYPYSEGTTDLGIPYNAPTQLHST